MPLSRSDAFIFGGVASRACGAPCSRIFRQNTARLLTMLSIDKLPKPPALVVASKIICDLQLPSKSPKQLEEMYRY